ncbi:haloacid dehalogenase-like hydrolase domain-containing protein 3 [Rhinatrema bivittatum]|uniref:haloacid dehalogenase-like hydrolase domain-containing protein 3 n=1 Tax=Rhinatrema bivittatum TaxID=194408 RepID=UPI001129693A|nr:haloacid dehalogenase-like hydrolase domain-containing protein 3 [Rhinatrema bivittatum]XP_029455442.1 haloacid dehalogenase-like hydrolase domain-containing protein 3 [Rhinatrema bivittatum]XP_029455443.1 haloacid dehalogenase-like hydrolase domain-containing protein 3 [Rhinatrema bivittatum]
MRLRLLTWDVKDTLVRLRCSVGEQYSAVAKSFGIQVEPKALESSFHKVYRVQNKLFPNYGLDRGLSSQQWWGDVVKQTFRNCGVSEDWVLAQIAENLYSDYSMEKNWEVLPGIRETLHQCHQFGLRLAVISNFDRRLEQILNHCNLGHHFEFIMTSEKAGVAKPDIRIFQKALCMAGVMPQHSAHFGDDYINDYWAARNAGMHSYLIQQDEHIKNSERHVPKEHILKSPRHVLTILKNAEC